MRRFVTLNILILSLASTLAAEQPCASPQSSAVLVKQVDAINQQIEALQRQIAALQKIQMELNPVPAAPVASKAGAAATTSNVPENYYRNRTSAGSRIQTGPRGGRYHYSSSGKKVYEGNRPLAVGPVK